jgi:phage baseplate assembly protein W
MFLYKHFMEHPERAGRPARGEEELDEEDADIKRNLEFILGTKRGCGYFPMGTFGVSDMGFRTPEQVVVTRTKELQENIRLYEPRVELLKINEEYDDDGERVRLVAVLRRRSSEEQLHLVVDLEKGTFDVQPAKDSGS